LICKLHLDKPTIVQYISTVVEKLKTTKVNTGCPAPEYLQSLIKAANSSKVELRGELLSDIFNVDHAVIAQFAGELALYLANTDDKVYADVKLNPKGGILRYYIGKQSTDRHPELIPILRT